MHAVAFCAGDQGQAEAGVARGRFDDRAAGRNFPSRSAASIMARATRSLIEPVGFWFSSFTKSWHGPVSIRVISTSGVSPMSASIPGGVLVLRSAIDDASIIYIRVNRSLG